MSQYTKVLIAALPDDDERAERKAYSAIERHAKRIVRDCAILSGIGDGNCGYIIDRVVENLREAGLYKDSSPALMRKQRIPNNLRKQVFERDGYRCVKCGSHIDLEADHIYPESLGGETVLLNLQTLCKPCNGKKSNKVDP